MVRSELESESGTLRNCKNRNDDERWKELMYNKATRSSRMRQHQINRQSQTDVSDDSACRGSYSGIAKWICTYLVKARLNRDWVYQVMKIKHPDSWLSDVDLADQKISNFTHIPLLYLNFKLFPQRNLKINASLTSGDEWSTVSTKIVPHVWSVLHKKIFQDLSDTVCSCSPFFCTAGLYFPELPHWTPPPPYIM